MAFTKEELKQLAYRGNNPAWQGMIFNAVVNHYDDMEDTAIEECIKLSLRIESFITEALESDKQ